MTRPHRAPAAILLLAVAAGCSSTDSQAPTPTRQYVGAQVQSVPENVLAAAVVVQATGYDSAHVEYTAGLAGPTVSTPALGFAGDSAVRIPVLGLDTMTTYTLRIILTLAGSADSMVDSMPFTSGSLPDWIPAIGSVGTSGEPGYLAISLPEGAVIVDNSGKIVWYHYSPKALNTFQAHPNGSYTILGADPAGPRFHLLNALGEETGTLECAGRPTRFQDVLIAEAGDAWLLCDEVRTMDLSALGGDSAALVTGTTVQHLDAAGTLLWEWNAFDHFDITDLPLASRTGLTVNFTHGNGFEFDADGNLLLSFRSLNEVTKVDRTTGAVIWRFGGLRNEFTILNDPKGFFEGQHGVRLAGPGRVQLMDNGVSAPSRMARYLVNPVTHTALMEWEFIDAPGTWTSVGGSTQYHLDGHATVSFGRAGRVVEVDEAGNRLWELTGLDGLYAFRAQRLSSLYSAGRGEPTR